MSLMPPTSKPAALSTSEPKPKARTRRTGTRGTVSIAPDTPLEDTPTPPTEPVPEPEPVRVRKDPPKARKGSLEARLAEAFASASVIPAFTGDQYSAFIIATRSAKFSHDLAELANRNAALKRILENALDGGAYGGVLFSGAAMFLPILWAYGILPAPPFDPFSAFYDPVPASVVPRSARKAGSSARGSRVATSPGGGSASTPPGDAPGDGLIPGVVTVKPGAHPPINPAAA